MFCEPEVARSVVQVLTMASSSTSASSAPEYFLSYFEPRSTERVLRVVVFGGQVGTVSAGLWRRFLPSLEDETIESTPGVCGGAARIAGTRIPVWTLVRYRQLGASDADLLTFYPSLHQEQLTAAWRYLAAHEAEIHAQILQNEAA